MMIVEDYQAIAQNLRRLQELEGRHVPTKQELDDQDDAARIGNDEETCLEYPDYYAGYI